jgi:hypothetical protein
MFCATKHIAYAHTLYELGDKRTVANLYLAYLHMRKIRATLSNTILALIEKYFLKIDISTELASLVTKVHAGTQDITTDNPSIQSLSLTVHDTAILFVLVARELYSFEIGYKDINTPFAIGFLQYAASNMSEDCQFLCRNIWKGMENNSVSSQDFIDLLKCIE